MGGFFGGGHMVDTDSTTFILDNGTQNTPSSTDECPTVDQRGGGIFGGGHLAGSTTCE